MEDKSTYSQSRIAKNTIILCIRMLITMGITLLSSRILLSTLGVEDYGVYNIIGGIVVLLSVVSNSMMSATQRFITYEIGKGSVDSVTSVFSMSLIAHMIIIGVIFVLGESVGLWYVINKLNVPEGRETAAFWVYQFTLLTVAVNLIRSPYNASVIAYEKMSFYAYMSVAESVMKLLLIYALIFITYDKLIIYGAFVFLANLVILLSYSTYCKKKFTTCNFRFIIDRQYFKKLFSFLGWSILGGASTLGTQQAGNLIINNFLGVAVNAAYGVATQVSGAINSFVSSFQMAFTPQITKLYAQERMSQFYTLCNSSALISYYILFLISFPIILNIDYVLNLWLVEVPQYAGEFCVLLIMYTLIDAIQAPFWIGINATGNIKVYEIWLSVILFLNIPASYYALKWGMPPYSILLIRVILNILTAVIRTIHVKIQIKYPIKQYVFNVVLRALVVTAISLLIWHLIPYHTFCTSFVHFIILYILIFLSVAVLVISVGFGKNERRTILAIIKKRLHIK